MTQQIINVGSAINDGTGDLARTAFTKSNANFTELYGVGQYIENTGTYPGFGSGAWFPPLNIVLGAGDWDISATSMFSTPSAPGAWWSSAAEVTTNSSTGTGTVPNFLQCGFPPVGSLNYGLTLPAVRFLLASSTTIYLQVFQDSGINLNWSGSIHARRVR